MRNDFLYTALAAIIVVILIGQFIWPPIYWILIVLGPILLIGFYDYFQSSHTIARNFPVVGRMRDVAQWMRPKVYQYFVEPDYDGRPFNRIFRNIVYQRSSKDLDTAPFGTQFNVYSEGYEWMNHSINPLDPHQLDSDPRVKIGGPHCKHPYHCSLFNVSAMSYGSLSKNAVMALNGGAAIGGFAHNTGEGGISPHHKKFGGDLIYQIGTGYFGCRNKDGRFDSKLYQEVSAQPSVKMIELKLSQGAKPGHGGILPGKKVTKEIAEIRNIEVGKDVISPPYHKEFDTPEGLLSFIRKLQDLSGGKPVGFKLCIGQKHEFIAICKAMVETGITPDFISVDGGEGGTGAAPLEFSNSVGSPYKEGLAFAYDALVGFDLKKDITLIAAGKIVTGFHMFRAFALGADVCYSARAMMMALGCIQALECNSNTCPTGVATQDNELVKGLVVEDKKQKVANYHHETVEAFVELLAAAGLHSASQIDRSHIHRRIVMNVTQQYDEIYPYIAVGCLLNRETVPNSWEGDWAKARADKF